MAAQSAPHNRIWSSMAAEATSYFRARCSKGANSALYNRIWGRMPAEPATDTRISEQNGRGRRLTKQKNEQESSNTCPTDPPRPCASRRVDKLHQHQTLQASQNLKQTHKGEGLPSPYPLPDGPARSGVRFLNLLVASWKSKICSKNVFPAYGPIWIRSKSS